MACENLKKMSLEIKTAFNFNAKAKNAIKIECGKCKACKLKRIKKWESRIMREVETIKNEGQIIYTTLTYNENNYIETNENLGTLEVQKWIKRLRKSGTRQQKNNFKYLISTERGGERGRIHHHAIILCEKKLIEKEGGGTQINGNYYFNSSALKWKNGFNSTNIIEANNKNSVLKIVRYVLKYLLKNPLKYVYSQKIGKTWSGENVKEQQYILYNGFKIKNPWNKKKFNLEEIKKINASKKSSNKQIKIDEFPNTNEIKEIK